MRRMQIASYEIEKENKIVLRKIVLRSTKLRSKRCLEKVFCEWRSSVSRLKRIKAFRLMLSSHDDTAALEARQKVTLGLFTLSNLYAEELESQGWTKEDLAMATKDTVNLCLTNAPPSL